MQRSQNPYDVFLKAKKVIYFCKFTFNRKIFFVFRLHRLWTLFSCLPANHYHGTGVVCAGNDAPGTEQSLTVLQPLGAALPSIRLGLKLGSKTGLQAGWRLSSQNRVMGVREQAEEKSSAEKDGKYCSPGHNRSHSAVLRGPCVADRRLPTRLQRRRMRGLCVLSL